MRDIKKAALATAFTMMAAVVPTESFANERIEGKVVRAELTMCDPRPTGGGCQGTLTLETKTEGKTQEMAITVIADTIIRRGQDYLVLPATQDSSVVVNYVTDKGKRIATSVEVVVTAR